MALTYTVKAGTGTSQVYDINWESELGFLDRSHVYVYVGKDYTQNQVVFTWRSDTQIECSVPSGTVFYIRRVAPRSKAWNNYTDGAVLREKNLDASYAQNLMIQEEVADGYLTTNTDVIFNNALDLLGNRIKRVGVAVDPKDAITKDITDAQARRILDLENSLTQGDLIYRRVTWTAIQDQEEFVPTTTFGGILAVYINGIHQIGGEAYENVDGHIIRTVPLDEGDRVVAVIGQEPKFLEPVQTDFRYVRYQILLTGGETTVSVPVQFKQVLSLYLNGVYQTYRNAFEYDVVSQTVTLAEPAEGGDELVLLLGDEPVQSNDEINVAIEHALAIAGEVQLQNYVTSTTNHTEALRLALTAALPEKRAVNLGNGNVWLIDDLKMIIPHVQFVGKSTLKRMDDGGLPRETLYMMELTGVDYCDFGHTSLDFNKDLAYVPPVYQVFGDDSYSVLITASTRAGVRGNPNPDKVFRWEIGYITGAHDSGMLVNTEGVDDAGFFKVQLGDITLYDAYQQTGLHFRGQHDYILADSIQVEDPLGRSLDTVNGQTFGAKGFVVTADALSSNRARHLHINSFNGRFLGSAGLFMQNVDSIRVNSATFRQSLQTIGGTPTVNSAVTLWKIDHALATVSHRHFHLGSLDCRDSFTTNPNVGFKAALWLDEGGLKDAKIESVSSDMDVRLGGSTTFGVKTYRNTADTVTMFAPARLIMLEGCEVLQLNLVGTATNTAHATLSEVAKIGSLNTYGKVQVVFLGAPATNASDITISNIRASDDTYFQYFRENGSATYLNLTLTNASNTILRFSPTVNNVIIPDYSEWTTYVTLNINHAQIKAYDVNFFSFVLNGVIPFPNMVLNKVMLFNHNEAVVRKPYVTQAHPIYASPANGAINMAYSNKVVDLAGRYTTGIVNLPVGEIVTVIAESGTLVHSSTLVNASGATITGRVGLIIQYLMLSGRAVQISN